jgi:hypothetical protein
VRRQRQVDAGVIGLLIADVGDDEADAHRSGSCVGNLPAFGHATACF